MHTYKQYTLYVDGYVYVDAPCKYYTINFISISLILLIFIFIHRLTYLLWIYICNIIFATSFRMQYIDYTAVRLFDLNQSILPLSLSKYYNCAVHM